MKKKKYNQAELSRMHYEAELELKKIHGVVGVGFGIKEVGGELTDEIAFRVYVKEKKKENEIVAENIIPKEIYGFKTDVHTVEVMNLNFSPHDNNRHRPIVGGIAISVSTRTSKEMSVDFNTIHESPFMNYGTLGSLAQTKDTKEIVLLSNYHVLHSSKMNTANVFQPKFMDEVDETHYEHIENDFEAIAIVLDKGKMDFHFKHTYPTETEAEVKEYYIDCEIAKIKILVEKTCKTSIGVNYDAIIKGLNNNSCNNITNVKRVDHKTILEQTPYLVYKVGATTGRTEGIVVDPFATKFIKIEAPDIGGDPFAGTIETRNVISIKSKSATDEVLDRFGEGGDSGSIILNKNNEAVGLLFGGVDPLLTNYAEIQEIKDRLKLEGKTDEEIDQSTLPKRIEFAKGRLNSACHIHPVLKFLNISLITKTCKQSSQRRRIPEINRTIDYDKVIHLNKILNSTSQKIDLALWYKMFNKEVLYLLNHKRQITVTWHRYKGPIFVAYFIKSLHDPDFKVTNIINDITLPQLLSAMRVVLLEHGSNDLKAVIIQYGDTIIECAKECTSLETLLERISNYQQI